MPVAGIVKRRKHLFGRQAAFGTKVEASRAYPFRGVPSVDLAWTDPDVDTGSIDPVTAPYRGPAQLTAPLDAPSLHYNDLPLFLSAILGGSVDPTNGATTARTWAYAPSSETIDDIDVFTYQFGDDVTTDWYEFGDGMVIQLEITAPEGLGALSASASWIFGSVASTGATDYPVDNTVPAPGLSVETNPAIVYLKDAALYVSPTYAGLASSQIVDALHSFRLRITLEVDRKRYANGDQSFDVNAYAVTSRQIELEATFAKTADIVGDGSESDAWMSETAVTRYARVAFTSTVEAETSVPYSWSFELPLRYYTRNEGEAGGNTVVVLTGRAFNEPTDFGGAFATTVVNTLDASDFDGTGS